MSLSSLAAVFLGAIGFLLFVGAGWLAVNNYETLFYETPESVGSNEHYKAERNFYAALWMYVIGIPFFVGAYFARRPQRVKIVRDYKDKDRGNDGEEPIVFYYAKYIGVLESNKSLPVEEPSYVYIDDDKIIVEFLKSKVRIKIPYSSMTDLQNVDAENKEELDRVIGLDSISARVGRRVGLLRKRHRIVTIIKYTDEDLSPQVIALDFLDNTKYAQPLIDKKMRQQAPKPLHNDKNQDIVSVADELGKLAKLKEQGIITEEEFLRVKNDLLKEK
jgi:hypothetical protein